MSRAVFTVAKPRSGALRALNYVPAVERMRSRRGSADSRPLGSLLAAMGRSYGAVFTRLDCRPPYGIELLSQSDMFATEPEGRRIRLDCLPRPERHEVQRGQVLLAGAGTLGATELYGRAVLADARLAGKYVGPDAMILEFGEPESDHALFAYAFLCTNLGVHATRSTSYGTKLLRFRPDLLPELPVPKADATLTKQVASGIRVAMQERERFASEVLAARAPIEALPEMQRAHDACAARRVRVGLHAPPLRTLGAWNHVSTGAALPLLQDAWNARLGDVVPEDGIFNGLRFARIECKPPHGIELLSQRDVFLLRPVPQRVAHPGFPDRVLFAPEHSLLVGGAGTLGEGEIFGRAVYVSESMTRYAVTQHMLRVQPHREHAALAYAFLSTLVGRRILRGTAVGTKILSMRPDLLRALPFPEVDTATAGQVTAHLHEAMRARDAAERAEAEAIRLVETEVIPAWLS
jgi:hypothetical protein